jgi:hypothetical protein
MVEKYKEKHKEEYKENECIAKIRKDEPTQKQQEELKEEIGYGLFFYSESGKNGKSSEKKLKEISPNGTTCFAKKNNAGEYFIKSNLGQLFDPYGYYPQSILRDSSIKFTRVTKASFDNFLKYLLTNNSVFFIRAEKEYLDNNNY